MTQKKNSLIHAIRYPIDMQFEKQPSLYNLLIFIISCIVLIYIAHHIHSTPLFCEKSKCYRCYCCLDLFTFWDVCNLFIHCLITIGWSYRVICHYFLKITQKNSKPHTIQQFMCVPDHQKKRMRMRPDNDSLSLYDFIISIPYAVSCSKLSFSGLE